MKISVVISSYNGEEYIKEELESIKNQTVSPDEVLIFDDGSSDKTVLLAQQYILSNNLESWKVINNKENKGWKRNFMEGIKKASGDIVFVADQDDIWMPDRIKHMSEVMREKTDILLLACKYQNFSENWKDEVKKIRNKKNTPELIQVDKKNHFFAMDYPGCTYCIRKDFFDQIYAEWNPKFAHDAFLWRYALAKDGAYVLNEILHLWRKHSQSTYAVIETKSKNYKFRYDALELYDLFLDTFLYSEKIDDNQKKNLKDYKKWIWLRKCFYQTRNPIYGIRLATHIDQYRDVRQYIGDWIISYKYK